MKRTDLGVVDALAQLSFVVQGALAGARFYPLHDRANPPNPLANLYRTADSVIESDGSFTLSCYGAFDGTPAGDYLVTVTNSERYALNAKKPPIELPLKYAKPATSGLTATVKAGTNDFTFELKR